MKPPLPPASTDQFAQQPLCWLSDLWISPSALKPQPKTSPRPGNHPTRYYSYLNEHTSYKKQRWSSAKQGLPPLGAMIRNASTPTVPRQVLDHQETFRSWGTESLQCYPVHQFSVVTCYGVRPVASCPLWLFASSSSFTEAVIKLAVCSLL